MTTPQLKSTTKTNLYEQDFYLWIETTAKQLKAGKFAEIDLENLIEEIESMGRIEKRTLESNLVVLLMHLLKYKCQPEKRSKSCLSTIFEHRRRLNKHFQDSPSLKTSLKNFFLETFVECYQDARQQASIETGLLLDIFPVESPFNTDECLNQDFLTD
ncbi:DUF29 domain-containing protein [Sphaerospermopsis sp. FACHB-1194]|uniref:DUF29 domain-containing protein n=1 Tax=Sphaerospermopsis sp. FACHB-1194 TaxID=2692862 RepID=UPI0016816FFD|nr:DUF29 domain-containing protein [Sphaerospermopsis sp. FACHB-1194]MBD2144888.1 DUF29 domain-containing protein [Sphaerospermopsis sp. FACHB-1194]